MSDLFNGEEPWRTGMWEHVAGPYLFRRFFRGNDKPAPETQSSKVRAVVGGGTASERPSLRCRALVVDT
jgi:hypothetical protein